MLSALLLTGMSLAATPDDWKGTRWLLKTECVLPLEVDLLSETNEEFILKAYQLRTTVTCNKAEQVGKNTVVTCEVEDAAMQATPHGESPSERELKNSQIVIEDVERRLEAGSIEININKKGKVFRVDVVGMEWDNVRSRRARERIRQLATDLAMGFSFQIPKKWEGTFGEMNSPLLRAPSVPSAGGSSTTSHAVSLLDGRTVVQSQGQGLALVPNTPWEFVSGDKVSGSKAQDQQVEGGGSNLSGEGSVGGTRIGGGTVRGGATPVSSTPETRPYDVNLTSVAVVDPATGMLTERVWNVAGAGTPSAVGSFQGVNLWYTGYIRQLTADEKPDLGPTQMVHPPGVKIGDLPAWEPME